MEYSAAENRYGSMHYRRCGRSGLKLPVIALGLWHNFGGVDSPENSKKMIRRAFDLGITHFDLANNYGPPPGSAEETFGEIFKDDLKPYRDELIISNKAGYLMWPGPYGEWGSRKYLVASIDQSLKRMGLDYVDIFYSHRFDPDTPLEETMGALDYIVRSGRALYAGVSNYSAEMTQQASDILRDLGTPCLIHQPKYSMFERWIENGLTEVLENEGIGCAAFSPLAQGMLTNRYLEGIQTGSRASKPHGFLKPEQITDDKLNKVKKINEIAKDRGQTMAQLAIAWVLRNPVVTTAIIGASKTEQIEDILKVLDNLSLNPEEQNAINQILGE